MSSSEGSPVGGKPNDPFEKYYQIKNMEKINEHNKRNKSSPPKSLLIAYILFLLKKIVNLIQPSKHYPDISKSTRRQIQTTLLQMQQALKTLMKEDRSQESLFLQHLAQLWQKMLEESLQLKKATSLAIHFKNFIKEIASYPKNEDHSLGYYLSECAGKSWLPFPYMELIQKLHMLHQKNPSDNPLIKWTLSLEKMIVLLNQD